MEGEIIIKDKTANPAPLGFFGLGFAATFLGLMVMEIFTDSVMVISTAIFLGGFAQLFASFELWKKGDTFGASAFGAFALFWFSWAFIQIATTIGLFGGVMPAMSASAGFWYLIIWGIIATLLTIVTFRIGVWPIIVTFIFLDLTFFSLALVGGMVAGIITLLLGLASLYTAIAIIMTEVGHLKCPGLCPAPKE
ncbi:MAG: acetate uptake transporter [Methanomethylovorans sp.]|uniref:acetate uptake transporter n=1 Tax=Methanomethylovorans sp. TaxID=2758717 RepID=UPI000A7F53B9|nr:acetate uptake transporter [Methanomethylovorans sp.]